MKRQFIMNLSPIYLCNKTIKIKKKLMLKKYAISQHSVDYIANKNIETQVRSPAPQDCNESSTTCES